jgi:PTH1 family peptidyl-tRNA hydrolase
LLVGLGNPGAQYASNRHNVGFMVAEAWAERRMPMPPWREKHKAAECSISSGVPGGGRVVVLMPQTFMNLSGESVGPAARYHRVPPERIIVVHDELDFPPGRLALKSGGGHGGHNGLRDIVRVLKSSAFLRLRVGIGRPVPPFRGDVSKWVLSDFTGDDVIALPDVISKSCDALDCLMRDGLATAMKRFHTKPPKKKKSKKPKAEDAVPVTTDDAAPSDPLTPSESA